MLDTAYEIETPEGVHLHLHLAGPVVRGIAWLFDLAIRLVVYTIALIPLAFLGQTGIGILLIILFVLEWFYPVLFEVYRRGQTPGKAIVGVVVVQEDGSPVGWPNSMLRNLLRFADFLPFFYGTGLVSVLMSRKFQRLGDAAAGTLVIYRRKPTKTDQKFPEQRPQAPPISLSLEEQRALISFAERSARLSKERAVELGETLAELTGVNGEDTVRKLHAYAAWLMGKTA